MWPSLRYLWWKVNELYEFLLQFLETIDMSSKGSMKKVKMECMSRCKKNSLCAGISLKVHPTAQIIQYNNRLCLEWWLELLSCFIDSCELFRVRNSLLHDDTWVHVLPDQRQQHQPDQQLCWSVRICSWPSSTTSTSSSWSLPWTLLCRHFNVRIYLINFYKVVMFEWVHFLWFLYSYRVASEYGDDVYDCCDQCFTQYVDVSTSGWCDCMTMMVVKSDSLSGKKMEKEGIILQKCIV